MTTRLPEAAATHVETLLSRTTPSALHGFTRRLDAFLRHLDDLQPSAPQGAYDALRHVLRLASDRADGSTAPAAEQRPDADHDYADWHRLTRSLWFNWADARAETPGGSLPPRAWCAMQVFARSDVRQPIEVAEVGAGVGRLAHDVMSLRPRSRLWIGDLSLESLILGALLHEGTALMLPRRTSFARSDTGIDWFVCRRPGGRSVPSASGTGPGPLAVYDHSSLPPDRAYDFVIACNAVSLFPDPLRTIERLVETLRRGGHLVLTDLYAWRVETPGPRRVAGPGQVADVLREAGCSISAQQSGIPYAEDWGFERTYCWTSHGLVARRDR